MQQLVLDFFRFGSSFTSRYNLYRSAVGSRPCIVTWQCLLCKMVHYSTACHPVYYYLNSYRSIMCDKFSNRLRTLMWCSIHLLRCFPCAAGLKPPLLLVCCCCCCRCWGESFHTFSRAVCSCRDRLQQHRDMHTIICTYVHVYI